MNDAENKHVTNQMVALARHILESAHVRACLEGILGFGEVPQSSTAMFLPAAAPMPDRISHEELLKLEAFGLLLEAAGHCISDLTGAVRKQKEESKQHAEISTNKTNS